jgi:hypothetical protein
MIAIGATVFLCFFSAFVSLFSYPNKIFWIPGLIVFVLTIIIYTLFFRDQETLEFNWDRLCFIQRVRKGKERISKFSEKTTEEQIKSFIPWEGINESTGLSRHKEN